MRNPQKITKLHVKFPFNAANKAAVLLRTQSSYIRSARGINSPNFLMFSNESEKERFKINTARISEIREKLRETNSEEKRCLLTSAVNLLWMKLLVYTTVFKQNGNRFKEIRIKGNLKSITPK